MYIATQSYMDICLLQAMVGALIHNANAEYITNTYIQENQIIF